LIIEPAVFADARGFFLETWNRRKFSEAGLDLDFVQDNHSQSVKNTLRGLHYQLQNTQGKLVRVNRGEVYDIAVDIRRSSPTFGRWVGEVVSAERCIAFDDPDLAIDWPVKDPARLILSEKDRAGKPLKTADLFP